MINNHKAINQFLNDVYDATENRSGARRRIERLIRDLPTTQNVDGLIGQMTEDSWIRVIQKKERDQLRKKRQRRVLRSIGIVFLSIILIAVIAYFVYQQDPGRWEQLINGTYTPTGTLIPTSTATPTSTPTTTGTPTPTPTPTLIPPSSLLIGNLPSINPALPAAATEVWIFDDTQAAVDPPYENQEVWKTPESTVTGTDPLYHYTEVGGVTITWHLDVPLNEGLYGVYILDTLDHSSGFQDFLVKLDGEAVEPYRGSGQVGYDHAPSQEEDNWLLVGFYEVAQAQSIQVETNVPERTADNPYAIDRLMLLKVLDDQRPILDALPAGRPLINLLDDGSALFFPKGATDPINEIYQGFEFSDALAWNVYFRSQYVQAEDWDQIWGSEFSVRWSSTKKLSQGTYELLVWVPAEHATAIVEFELLAGDKVIERDNPAPLNQEAHSGVWFSMGTWTISEPTEVSVRMNIIRDGQTLDAIEIGVDAVALVRVNDEGQ